MLRTASRIESTRRRARRCGGGPASQYAGVHPRLSRHCPSRRGPVHAAHALSRRRSPGAHAPQRRASRDLPAAGEGHVRRPRHCLLRAHRERAFGCALAPTPRGRSIPAALHLGHHGGAQGRRAPLSHPARQRAPRRAAAWAYGEKPRPLRRAAFAPLWPVFAALRVGGGRLHRPASRIQARRARSRHTAIQTHGVVDRARACRRVPRGRRVREVRLVFARARDRFGIHGAARAHPVLFRKGPALRGDAALGHDRAAGRPLYASRRPARNVRHDRRTAEPGYRGSPVRRRRAAGARPAPFLRIPQE